MKKITLKKGTAAALAITAALAVGITAFAVSNKKSYGTGGLTLSLDPSYGESGNEYSIEGQNLFDDGQSLDMDKLTEEEQKELNSIYERCEEINQAIFGENYDAAEEEVLANYSKYEKELRELDKKAAKLEEKAMDYGNLTEEEIRELQSVYERFDAIEEEVYGEDGDLTEEEIESRFSKYESEWNELEQKAQALEEKAWG